LLVLPAERFDAVIAAHVMAVPAVRARRGIHPAFAVPRVVTVSGPVSGAPRIRRFVPGRSSVADPTIVAPMTEARNLDAADVLLVIPDSADVRDGDTVAALSLRGGW
jgi:hypothetical protein